LRAVLLDSKGTIELEDYYLRAKIAAAIGRFQPGETITVGIESIEPANGEVRFRLTSQ